MRTCLYKTLVSSIKNPFKVIQHFIRLYAGLVAAAQQGSDMNAVSYIVEMLVECYQKEYEQAVQEHDRQVCRLGVASPEENEHLEYSKTPINLLIFIAYLYAFNLTTSTLLVDLLKECAQRFTELDVEEIFMVMKISGFKLRGDTPADLKDLILSIKQNADKEEWK